MGAPQMTHAITDPGFGEAVVSGGHVAFVRRPAAHAGVYSARGGELRVVADGATAVPGGEGTYDRLLAFEGLAIDGDRIAFATADRSGAERGGIYPSAPGSTTVGRASSSRSRARRGDGYGPSGPRRRPAPECCRAHSLWPR